MQVVKIFELFANELLECGIDEPKTTSGAENKDGVAGTLEQRSTLE
jgi:hypothetical protein